MAGTVPSFTQLISILISTLGCCSVYFHSHFMQGKANRAHGGYALCPALCLERYQARIQTQAGLSLPNHRTTLPLYGTAGEDRRIVGQRNPCKIGEKEKKKTTPLGPIKCLINSRRRIGRNNEHLSESFIACKSLFPAFSHLIFTAGLGARYYHYLHFIGEERKALTPPSLSGQTAHLGGGQ